MTLNEELSDGSGRISAPTIDFVSGVIAGAAGLVVGQPFDVIKVRYQTPQYAGRYSSTWRALGSIVREEKVQGLFKGVMSPMAGIAFINGVVFTSYSLFMRLQLPTVDTGQEPHLGQICLAGAGSGVVAATLTCPTELIKIRQQSAPPHLNLSAISVCRSILRDQGLKGLYRGFPATAVRDLAYGPYFCTYEAVCRFFKWMKPMEKDLTVGPYHHHPQSLIDEAEAELSSGLSWGELMIAGAAAGVAGWVATFPFDVIKTRMQTIPWPIHGQISSIVSPSMLKPQSFKDVAVNAIRREGWRVMFAGLGPTLIRAIPTNMVVFLTFEAFDDAVAADIADTFAKKSLV